MVVVGGGVSGGGGGGVSGVPCRCWFVINHHHTLPAAAAGSVAVSNTYVHSNVRKSACQLVHDLRCSGRLP